jgi:hypothetical protein
MLEASGNRSTEGVRQKGGWMRRKASRSSSPRNPVGGQLRPSTLRWPSPNAPLGGDHQDPGDRKVCWNGVLPARHSCQIGSLGRLPFPGWRPCAGCFSNTTSDGPPPGGPSPIPRQPTSTTPIVGEDQGGTFDHAHGTCPAAACPPWAPSHSRQTSIDPPWSCRPRVESSPPPHGHSDRVRGIFSGPNGRKCMNAGRKSPVAT